MNVIDIIIIVILLWGAWKGFSNGLIISVASFIAILAGIWGTIKFSDIISVFLTSHFTINSKYLRIISFAITFLIIIIIIHLIARLLDKLLSAVALGFVNKLLGAVFGVLKYFFILSVFLFILNSVDNNTHLLPGDIKAKSLLYNKMNDISLKLFPSLKTFYYHEINDITPGKIQSIH